MRRRAVLAASLAAPAVRAQSGRLVTMIVPFTPGAPPDLVARILAQSLAPRWGRPVVVDNRPGASGTIGAEFAARAAADGETLLVHTMTLAISASLYRNLRYDPVAAFAPVVLLVETVYALCTHAATAPNVPTLLALAREGRATYASPGVGTPHHMIMELFRRQAGVPMLHVPYRGSAGAVNAVVAGEVAAMFMPIGAALELASDARVRLVAVADAARRQTVPTIAEYGIEGVGIRDWFGVLTPGRPPDAVVDRLNADLNATLREVPVMRALEAQSLSIVGGPAAALRDRLAADLPRWAAVVRDANITPD